MNKARPILNPIDLHKQYDWVPEQSALHIMHFYDRRTGTWNYGGHRCSKCNGVFKSMKAIQTHLEVCLYLKGERRLGHRGKPKLEPDKPIAILDMYGNEWQPLIPKINQKLSDK